MRLETCSLHIGAGYADDGSIVKCFRVQGEPFANLGALTAGGASLKTAKVQFS